MLLLYLGHYQPKDSSLFISQKIFGFSVQLFYYTVGDKIKFPLRLKKSFESRYKAAKQVSGTSDFPHKSRLQLRVKSL